MTLTAVLTGTFSNPELRFELPWGARMPRGGDAGDWVKKLPGRRWDRSAKTWYITGTGTKMKPDAFFVSHGIEVDFSEATGNLAGLDSLDTLWRPLVKRSSRFSSMALVRHRLAGYDRVSALLGPGAAWDKKRGLFNVQLADLVDNEERKRGLQMDDATYEAAVQALQIRDIPEDVRLAARELASSTGVGGDEQKKLSNRTLELIDTVAAHTGYLPKWFGLDLYPFQAAGAYAIAGGHRALCDAPGLGKGSPEWVKILTPTGWTTYGDIAVGQPVIGRDGHATEVTGVFPRGALPTFTVTMSDGASVVVDGDHLWEIENDAGATSVVATRELMNGGLAGGATIPTVAPVHFDDYGPLLGTIAERWNTLDRILAGASYSAYSGVLAVSEDDEDGADIIHDVSFLLRSLGGLIEELPPRSGVRLFHLLSPSGDPQRSIVSIEPAKREHVICISVASEDQLYVTEDFIVTHNTRQSLAAAAIARADRVVIVVPPLVVTNFCREALAALGPFYAPDHKAAKFRSDALAKPKKGRGKPAEFPPYIVPVRAGRKVPPFPDRGVIVVADSLIASRPALLDELVAWAPDAALFDEVHRARTWDGVRATAERNLACNVGDLRVPMTGTPFLASPSEVTNMLAIAGVLDPIFGGPSKFIDRYTTENFFGQRMPNRKLMPELEQRLTQHCWVRRNKKDVLKQLPKKLRTTRVVDIDPKGFREAHDTLYEKITEWLEEFQADEGRVPNAEEIKAYARTHIELITPLRAAAGVAKIPGAIDIVTDWLERTTEVSTDGTKEYTRPLVVWVHHQDVMTALVGAVESAGLSDCGFIDGSTPGPKRQLIADQMQNGEIGVIFCSIGAAGFGITLTAASDVIFVETDWTPANISQAEDRCVLEGQMVQLMSGPERIENVAIGDRVLTHLGNFQAVTDTWVTGHKSKAGSVKSIAAITYGDRSEPLRVTSDHEVWARRTDGSIGWALAGDLAPGDDLAKPDTCAPGSWIWLSISAVDLRDAIPEDRLWDLSVEGDESYVVGAAAVHNCHRIGQSNPVMVTTLLAVDTLDPHMRAILRNKAKDLDVLMPGADNNVTEMSATLNETDNVYEESFGDDPELEKQFQKLGDIIERIVLDVVNGHVPRKKVAA